MAVSVLSVRRRFQWRGCAVFVCPEITVNHMVKHSTVVTRSTFLRIGLGKFGHFVRISVYALYKQEIVYSNVSYGAQE
jgi:D-arabinose 1-dehydrogenase-like Zn-dependent alcohol dehydrogenase